MKRRRKRRKRTSSGSSSGSRNGSGGGGSSQHETNTYISYQYMTKRRPPTKPSPNQTTRIICPSGADIKTPRQGRLAASEPFHGIRLLPRDQFAPWENPSRQKSIGHDTRHVLGNPMGSHLSLRSKSRFDRYPWDMTHGMPWEIPWDPMGFPKGAAVG